jgi:hypothetical protein
MSYEEEDTYLKLGQVMQSPPAAPTLNPTNILKSECPGTFTT